MTKLTKSINISILHINITFMNNIKLCNGVTEFQLRLKERERDCNLTDEKIVDLDRKEIFSRLKNAIGNTALSSQYIRNGNLLLQKNETQNPTETHYDRCYLNLLRHLEESGTIFPGDTLLETTSGSAGISFAWLCKKLDYKSVVFVPGFVPEPRLVEIQNLADEVYHSHDKKLYLKACADMMIEYYRSRKEEVLRSGHKIYIPNHSQDYVTPRAFSSIADEVSQQFDGNIDYFVGGVGNGSTLLGIGKRLKQYYPDLQVIAYEPRTACPYYKKFRSKWGKIAPSFMRDDEIPDDFSYHSLPGTGGFGNIDFPFMNDAIENGVIDDICPVPDKEIITEIYDSIDPLMDLPIEHGNTSLISQYVARVMARQTREKIFLSLIYDKADRYGEPRYVDFLW